MFDYVERGQTLGISLGKVKYRLPVLISPLYRSGSSRSLTCVSGYPEYLIGTEDLVGLKVSRCNDKRTRNCSGSVRRSGFRTRGTLRSSEEFPGRLGSFL